MHEPHRNRLHHQPFTADTEGDDLLGFKNLLAQFLQLRRVARLEKQLQITAGPEAKRLEVEGRFCMHILKRFRLLVYRRR